MVSDSTHTSVSYHRLLTDHRFVVILLVTATATIGSVLPPALPGIAAGIDVDEATVGAVITAYKLPSILVIPVAAAIADIYGRRSVLLPSLLLFAAGGGAIFLADSFATVLLCSLFLGVGAATLFPLSVTLLGDFFDGARNSAGQGIRVGVIGIAIVIIPAVTGFLAGVQWNYPFLLFLLGLPVFGIVYVSLAEPIRDTNRRESLSKTVGSYGGAVRKELSDRSLSVLLCGGLTRGVSNYALLTFVPLFAVGVLDATLFEAGLLLSARGVVYIVLSPLAGGLVARFARKYLLFVSLGICAAALVAIPFSPGLPWLAVIVVVHAIGDALFDPVNKGTVTMMARREYRAGIVNSLYVLKRIGQTGAPVALGLVLSLTSYRHLFLLSGLFVATYLVAFGLWFRFEPVD